MRPFRRLDVERKIRWATMEAPTSYISSAAVAVASELYEPCHAVQNFTCMADWAALWACDDVLTASSRRSHEMDQETKAAGNEEGRVTDG
jgi:hypothetical protein